jgi:hypothetical protein
MTRIHYAAAILGAAVYACLGELYYRGDRRVRDIWGHCVEVPVTYEPVALAVGMVAFVASAAYFARSGGRRWKASAALHAAVALLAGGAAGVWWYGHRMMRGSECAELQYCTWCTTRWLEDDRVELLLLALMAALLSLPIGWLARRIGRRRRHE